MDSEHKQPNFPYVSYPTFKAFIRHLHDTVTTEQIDNTMMPQSMSGSARAAVTSALKSLGLIDAQNNTTQKLKDLVTAFDSKEWPAAVKKCVLSAYGNITESFNLKSATRKQVEEMFEDATPQMKDRYIRFLLSANKEAGIDYSPHLKIRRRLPKKRTDVATQKSTASDKEINKPQGKISSEEKTPSDMFDLPIPIALANSCFIRVPRNINAEQVILVKAAVDFIEAMAKQSKK